MEKEIKSVVCPSIQFRASYVLAVLSLLFVGNVSADNWVPRNQAGYPAATVPSWHWFNNARQVVDTHMSSQFSGNALHWNWERNSEWNGKRGNFPFEFSFWQDNRNYTSQVANGKLNLRIYWNQQRNTWLGGYVRTKQRYTNGFYQIQSKINKSEKGWVHGFWMFSPGAEIDIYEIKGIGYSNKDERTQMPTNVHRNIWNSNTKKHDDYLKGFGKTIYGLNNVGYGSTFGLLRSANYIEFFNNRQMVRRIDKGNNPHLAQVFTQPQHLILNSEYQDWIGRPYKKNEQSLHEIEYVARYMW